MEQYTPAASLEARHQDAVNCLRAEVGALLSDYARNSDLPDQHGLFENKGQMHVYWREDSDTMVTAFIHSEHMVESEGGAFVDADPSSIVIITNRILHTGNNSAIIFSRDYHLNGSVATLDTGVVEVDEGRVVKGSHGFLISNTTDGCNIKRISPVSDCDKVLWTLSPTDETRCNIEVSEEMRAIAQTIRSKIEA